MKYFLLIIFLVYGINFTIIAQDRSSGISVKDDDIKVSWIRDSANTSYFEVERKSSRFDLWRQVYRVNAENKKRFSFVDKDLSGDKYYYRIKSVTKSGSSRYSNVLEADLIISFRFSLEQNYPNPFNPDTRINYSIPFAAYVDLRIYNLLGQEVQTLVSENKEAGEYSVNFNADELNSGLYIYKLIAGDKVLTRKMTLLK